MEFEDMLRHRITAHVLKLESEQGAVYGQTELEEIVIYKMGILADKLVALLEANNE